MSTIWSKAHYISMYVLHTYVVRLLSESTLLWYLERWLNGQAELLGSGQRQDAGRLQRIYRNGEQVE